MRRFVATMASSARRASVDGPVFRSIQQKLTTAFSPEHLEVLNESHMHSVPPGSETHFKVPCKLTGQPALSRTPLRCRPAAAAQVVVVSKQFDAKPLVDRHRMVHAALQQELSSGVHALSIVAKTPAQWEVSSEVAKSPQCLGGGKHELGRRASAWPVCARKWAGS